MKLEGYEQEVFRCTAIEMLEGLVDHTATNVDEICGDLADIEFDLDLNTTDCFSAMMEEVGRQVTELLETTVRFYSDREELRDLCLEISTLLVQIVIEQYHEAFSEDNFDELVQQPLIRFHSSHRHAESRAYADAEYSSFDAMQFQLIRSVTERILDVPLHGGSGQNEYSWLDCDDMDEFWEFLETIAPHIQQQNTQLPEFITEFYSIFGYEEGRENDLERVAGAIFSFISHLPYVETEE